ncbi:MAG: DUF305 domain-containing protein [Bdellovibrionales bacterium]|nr:DUF305 domain-containing protein [Bdellovibrionales bacterium]
MASSAKPLSELLDHAMDIMDVDISVVDLKKNDPNSMFLKMMIAHHQGAINMAHALIVHSQSSEMKNFAISVIVAQENEVQYMKTLLARSNSKSTEAQGSSSAKKK